MEHARGCEEPGLRGPPETFEAFAGRIGVRTIGASVSVLPCPAGLAGPSGEVSADRMIGATATGTATVTGAGGWSRATGDSPIAPSAPWRVENPRSDMNVKTTGCATMPAAAGPAPRRAPPL